jgi:hypothetical protein
MKKADSSNRVAMHDCASDALDKAKNNQGELFSLLDRISKGSMITSYSVEQDMFESIQAVSKILASYIIGVSRNPSGLSESLQNSFINWTVKMYNTYANTQYKKRTNNQIFFYAAQALASLYISGCTHNFNGFRSKNVADAAKEVAGIVFTRVNDINSDGWVTGELERVRNGKRMGLSYTSYWIIIAFACLTLIKETNVPFDFNAVKEKMRKLVNNLVPDTSNKDYKRVQCKMVYDYIAKKKIRAEYTVTVTESSDTFHTVLWNVKWDNLKATWQYLFEDGPPTNLSFHGYGCTASDLAIALRSIKQPMGAFNPFKKGSEDNAACVSFGTGFGTVIHGSSMNPDTEYGKGNVITYKSCDKDRGKAAAYTTGMFMRSSKQIGRDGPNGHAGYYRIPDGKSVTFFETYKDHRIKIHKVIGPKEFCLGGAKNIAIYKYPSGKPVANNFSRMSVEKTPGVADVTTTAVKQ